MSTVVAASLSSPFPVSCPLSITLVVCRQCQIKCKEQKQSGADLARVLSEKIDTSAIQVHQVACLGNCQKGLTVALIVPHSWNYVFNGLTLLDADVLVKGAKALAFSGDGQISWSEWPKTLRGAMVAQIPSFDLIA